MREFFEETGIAVRNPTLFATYDLKKDKDDNRHFSLSVFRVEADPEGEAIAADDAADPGWYSVEEIRNLPRACERAGMRRKAGGGTETRLGVRMHRLMSFLVFPPIRDRCCDHAELCRRAGWRPVAESTVEAGAVCDNGRATDGNRIKTGSV